MNASAIVKDTTDRWMKGYNCVYNCVYIMCIYNCVYIIVYI